MDCSEVTDRLSEFLEGDLPSREQEQVAAHLEGCASCRRELETLQDLVEKAGRLPEGIAPGRELWPGIRERLMSRVQVPQAAGASRRPSWKGWWPLAAAAAIVVLALSGIIPFGGAGPDDRGPGWPVAGLVEEFQTMTSRLEEEIRDRDSVFPEATRSDLDRNLAAIDEAIARSRNALSEHPESRRLRLALSDNYQRKVELLEWAVRIAAEFNRG